MATKTQPKEEVIKKEPEPLVTDQVPDYLKGTGAGNENVTAKDLTIPRLQIIQDLSPELDADNAERFIVEAVKGNIFNTLTRDCFDSVKVVNVFYRMEYNVFVDRKRGGGFRGTYQNMPDAVAAVNAADHPEDLQIIDTGVHFVLILDDAGNPVGEAAIPMKSTQLKVSRNWNSLIRMRGDNLDRWAGVWQLATIKQKNDKGNYHNFNVSPAGWISQQGLGIAKRFYDAIVGGKKDIDRNEMHDDVREEEAF